eukprot:TRINITY_DN137_c1_g3_i1.p1 TRINITY_DN137_c1_g3~~TRINITY_DN137_c1_g3_i1.p1  ORF type:complete len:331 (+),score=-25.87 TRINITY_DN137_c1_g3_i1:1192-2184(+)
MRLQSLQHLRRQFRYLLQIKVVVRNILRYNSMRVSLSCSAAPIAFAPSLRMSLATVNQLKESKGCTYMQSSKFMVHSQRISNCFCSFMSNFILAYWFVKIGDYYTKIQHGQCIILLQHSPNRFGPFVTTLVVSQRQHKKNQSTEIQLSERAVFLQGSRYFFHPFIPNLIKVYTVQLPKVQRSSVVSVLLSFSAAAISFAPAGSISFLSIDNKGRILRRHSVVSFLFFCTTAANSFVPSFLLNPREAIKYQVMWITERQCSECAVILQCSPNCTKPISCAFINDQKWWLRKGLPIWSVVKIGLVCAVSIRRGIDEWQHRMSMEVANLGFTN